MRFILKIDSDNAAMVDDVHGETARILEDAARRVREGHSHGKVRDANGNTVGTFALIGW
ncbi:MAG TPA: hypothetical protein VIG47_08685 [Gemmatimonadaceae bacterium]|jgi:hypothetical protein